MTSLQIFILLMSIAVLLVDVAQKIGISYPIALVFGGAAVGFIPGLNEINFDPNIILGVVLPPILYYSAHNIAFHEFKRNLHQIFSLALVLVLITTLVIGVIVKWFFPNLPWPLAFAFGAIVSPPDAVAVTAILKRFNVSHRLLAILEGESLINDASGIVLYRVAIYTLLSGSFSLGNASLEFAWTVIGGLLIGFLTAFFFNYLSSRFFDPTLAVVYSFTIPYMTYILADLLAVSGVLAIVVNGLIGSRLLLSTHFSSVTRIVGWTAWDVFIILLNCFIFILIGSQLRGIISRMTTGQLIEYSLYGVLITIVLTAIRLLWVYINTALSFVFTHKQFKGSSQPWREATLIGWAGMRGIVSLTIALALPLTMPDGTPLPDREMLIFLTFVVIFFTLLIPGLSLSKLIQWLKIDQNLHKQNQSLLKARKELEKIAIEEINQLHANQSLNDEERDFLLTYFNIRYRLLDLSRPEKHLQAVEFARLKVLGIQKEHLLQMWTKQEIEDDILALLERELDMAESHLARAQLRA